MVSLRREPAGADYLSNSAELPHDFFMTVPNTHARVIEFGRLGLPDDGGNRVAHGRHRESEVRKLADTKNGLVEAGPTLT